MRTFSSAVQTVLNSDTINYLYLIKLSFNTTYYLTSYNTNVTYDGNVYTASSGLFEFDSPDFSSIVDREAYRVVVTDNSNAFKAELEANVVGKDMQVWVALIDANGNPLLSTSDVISIYKGVVDSPTITNDYEKKLVNLEGSSPIVDLDGVNSFITSKDGMDQVSATDTSFDEVFDNKQVTLKWGKK